MSVLVVGISHRSAPVALLERVAVDADGAAKLAKDVAAGEHVVEAAVIATCNRLEIYADVDRFHGSVEELSGLLVERPHRRDYRRRLHAGPKGHGGGGCEQHERRSSVLGLHANAGGEPAPHACL